MTQLFECPKCGYRNYDTQEDFDARREEVRERLRRKDTPTLVQRLRNAFIGKDRTP